jgi:hypothetical protein
MSPDRSSNVRDTAAAFTRKAALMVATTPTQGRAFAFAVIERDFDEAIMEVIGDREFGREWLRSQMDRSGS